MLKSSSQLKILTVIGLLFSSAIYASKSSISVFPSDAERTIPAECSEGTLTRKKVTCPELVLKSSKLECIEPQKKLFCACTFKPKKSEDNEVDCTDLGENFTQVDNPRLFHTLSCESTRYSGDILPQTVTRMFPRSFEGTEKEQLEKCQQAASSAAWEDECDQQCTKSIVPEPSSRDMSCCKLN